MRGPGAAEATGRGPGRVGCPGDPTDSGRHTAGPAALATPSTSSTKARPQPRVESGMCVQPCWPCAPQTPSSNENPEP